jgi:BirA family biotin operon repressor/biotin-[acetyl-CoA-carboxylase] ligase
MTSPLVARLFSELTDGQFHSGEQLAHTLGVTRSAIWKAVNALRGLGVELEAIRNRGYKLLHQTELLNEAGIRAGMSRPMLEKLQGVDVRWSLESTNSTLAARPAPEVGYCEALLAEVQTAGRGRRGRVWLAPPGGSLCLSLAWTFPQLPRDVGALSLAIGVCVLRALQAQGVQGAQLKWPNDILMGGKKLGGILIELRAESAGPASVVVGIGLNVALGPALLDRIAATGLPATDLTTAGVASKSRNAIASRVIEACMQGLMQFEREGLQPFVEEWSRADALHGRPIAVHVADQAVRGLARGVDLSGALLVETPQGLEKFYSGDVTVRAVA